MKHTGLAASIFLGCMSVGSAWAVDLTLFEQDFLRGKGKQDSFAKSFVAQDHKARLIIRNGEESGGKRVSSASVRLNGKEIVGPRDFNQKVSVQEFTVDLLKNNKIAVELSSKPGSSLHVQVIQKIDADAAAVVGPEGAVVEVKDAASPIYGAKIDVPAGALDEVIVLTMKQVELKQELPGNSVLAGPVVDFGPDKTQFNTDVVITLPYFDEDNNGYLDATGTHEENVFPMVYNEETLNWEFPETNYQDVTLNFDRYAVAHFSLNTNGSFPKFKVGVNYSLIEDEETCDTVSYCKKSIIKKDGTETTCSKEDNINELIIKCGDDYSKIYNKSYGDNGGVKYTYSESECSTG